MALVASYENPSPGYVHKLIVECSYGDPRQVKELVKDFEDFIKLFDDRSREYGEHAFVLGSGGQYADMSRKMGKLKTVLWDRNPDQLTSEGIEEVVNDMIGHCFLTLQCLRREAAEKDFAGNIISSGSQDRTPAHEEFRAATSAEEFQRAEEDVRRAIEARTNAKARIQAEASNSAGDNNNDGVEENN